MFNSIKINNISLALSILVAFTSGTATAKTVKVDPNNRSAYPTLASAVETLKAGDTLWIEPGTGPYREILRVSASGTESEPIIIEGNGNEITGFEPLNFESGKAKVEPGTAFVLRHGGKRIKQHSNGIFEEGIQYDPATGIISLPRGTTDQGWEISSRDGAVKIGSVSNHIYRNIVATGSLNDGFNIHGNANALYFENVVGCQNLDEGFSAHDNVEATVKNSRFFENDNGLLNVGNSYVILEGVDFYNNLGLGLAFSGEARFEAKNVRTWGNGITQLLIRSGVDASCDVLEVYQNDYVEKPWVTYMESKNMEKVSTKVLPHRFEWRKGEPEYHNKTTPENDR